MWGSGRGVEVGKGDGMALEEELLFHDYIRS